VVALHEWPGHYRGHSATILKGWKSFSPALMRPPSLRFGAASSGYAWYRIQTPVNPEGIEPRSFEKPATGFAT